MEELVSLIVFFLAWLFPFLFLVLSRRKIQEKRRAARAEKNEGKTKPKFGFPVEKTQKKSRAGDDGKGKFGLADESLYEKTEKEPGKSHIEPDSIIARIMEAQGIRRHTRSQSKIFGYKTPSGKPEIIFSPEQQGHPKFSTDQSRKDYPIKKGLQASSSRKAGSGRKNSAERKKQFIHTVESLPPLQKAIVLSEVLGTPKGLEQ